MKLSDIELQTIRTVVNTATLVDISNVIIEPGKIRAMDDNQTVVLFQDQNVPTLSFGSIGLNRISTFISRLDLASAQDDFYIDVTAVGDNPKIGFDKYNSTTDDTAPMWARSLTMYGRDISIEYRCASPQTIKAPKVKASSGQYSINLKPDVVTILQKGKSIMKTPDVTINYDKKGVSLIFTDINGDTFSYHMTDEITNLDGKKPVDFSYRYDIDLLLPLFKTNPTSTISLSARGSLIFKVGDIELFIMAKI